MSERVRKPVFADLSAQFAAASMNESGVLLEVWPPTAILREPSEFCEFYLMKVTWRGRVA